MLGELVESPRSTIAVKKKTMCWYFLGGLHHPWYIGGSQEAIILHPKMQESKYVFTNYENPGLLLSNPWISPLIMEILIISDIQDK